VIEVNPNELKRAVESQHGCTATLIQSVPIKETFDGKTVWGRCRPRFSNPRSSQGQQSLCLVITD
jgi:hypothetical protein